MPIIAIVGAILVIAPDADYVVGEHQIRLYALIIGDDSLQCDV